MLQPTTKPLFANGSKSQLNVLGRFDATIVLPFMWYKEAMVLYSATKQQQSWEFWIFMSNHIADNLSTHESLSRQYPTLFHGIGKLKGIEVKLHIDPTVQPVAQQARRIPFHLRKKVEKKLEHLEQQGIIEKVDGSTPWISPLVVNPKKDGDVHIRVDMRMANKAIDCERHPTPTVEDLIHTLNGATVFSNWIFVLDTINLS